MEEDWLEEEEEEEPEFVGHVDDYKWELVDIAWDESR